jgi:hypothetical protein
MAWPETRACGPGGGSQIQGILRLTALLAACDLLSVPTQAISASFGEPLGAMCHCAGFQPSPHQVDGQTEASRSPQITHSARKVFLAFQETLSPGVSSRGRCRASHRSSLVNRYVVRIARSVTNRLHHTDRQARETNQRSQMTPPMRTNLISDRTHHRVAQRRLLATKTRPAGGVQGCWLQRPVPCPAGSIPV